MPFYIRVLAESDRPAPLAELRKVLPEGFELLVSDGDEDDWSRLLLRQTAGAEIALIERDPVAEGELGAQEIEELIDDLDGYKPYSAVTWLQEYLPKVKVVYAMQLLSGTNVQDGWLAVHRVQAYFWKKFGGILQADNEGFSNREGYHILWQFPDRQQGDLDVAVLDESGLWLPFTIDMADEQQVAAFQAGKPPSAPRHESR